SAFGSSQPRSNRMTQEAADMIQLGEMHRDAQIGLRQPPMTNYIHHHTDRAEQAPGSSSLIQTRVPHSSAAHPFHIITRFVCCCCWLHLPFILGWIYLRSETKSHTPHHTVSYMAWKSRRDGMQAYRNSAPNSVPVST